MTPCTRSGIRPNASTNRSLLVTGTSICIVWHRAATPQAHPSADSQRDSRKPAAGARLITVSERPAPKGAEQCPARLQVSQSCPALLAIIQPCRKQWTIGRSRGLTVGPLRTFPRPLISLHGRYGEQLRGGRYRALPLTPGCGRLLGRMVRALPAAGARPGARGFQALRQAGTQ